MQVKQKIKREAIPDLEYFPVLNAIQAGKFHQIQLIQNLDAAIYTCDSNGFITFYNKAAAALWGRKPEIGVDVWCGSWKIFQPDGTPLNLNECPMAKTLREKRSVRNEEIIIERLDGQRRHVMPHPDPIFDSEGNLTGAVNLLIDITDLKEREKELHASKSKYKKIALELEQRVDERTRELKEANNALHRTNVELEQFAFIASHDLQEPLRKIRNYVNRLEFSNNDALDIKSKVFLHKVSDSAERMSVLIKDLLEYSRLLSIDNKFVKVDLNKIVKDEMNDFELGIEQCEAEITIGKLPFIKAIPLQMGQLFHNLLGNSFKFSRNSRPCKIDITSHYIVADDIYNLKLNPGINYCEIVVMDNGIGFKQEYAEKIFQIFERLNDRSQFEGTGIGLALCRKIVNIHNGIIFAESNENVGTAIHVILPVGS